MTDLNKSMKLVPKLFMIFLLLKKPQSKLEQLERLRSEDTPHRLMITHTVESYWMTTQKKTKSKLQI